MCKNVDGLNGRAGKAIDWAVTIARIITPLILTVMGWAWWNHENRIDAVAQSVAVMEGNRFTMADGLEVWKRMEAITAMREDIAEIKREVEYLRKRRPE